jgi:hypothetical protein
MKNVFGGVVVGALFAVFSLGCASTEDKEKTAPEHRAEANRHRVEAREALDGYAPGDKEVRVNPKAGSDRTGPMDSSPDAIAFPVEAYNPTSTQLKLAEKLLAHAHQHEVAATKLENEARNLCAAFPPETRARSPLLGTLSEVKVTPKGVVLRFKKEFQMDAITRHIECHLAMAKAAGFGTVPDCPLHLQGVKAARAGDEVRLTSEDPAVVTELQRLALAAFGED